jgi:long-chain fatty acid transport protein
MNRPSLVLFGCRAWGCSLALVVTLSGTVSATGFFINQQSVRGLGRVHAGSTVSADDLGTIFFNPAGLTKVVAEPAGDDCIRVSLAAHLIVPRATQRAQAAMAATPGTLGALVPIGGGDARNPTAPTPVPHFYAATSFFDNRGAFGVGVNAPFGLATQFDPDWHGRYDATEASLRTLNVSMVGAYRFDSGLSVGGGLDLQYARTLLSTAIPNPLAIGGPTASTDGRIQTKGHDAVTPGFNVGVIYDIDTETRVGAHYRSGMKHEIDGAAEIHGLQGPLAGFNGAVDARAQLNLPAIATVGVRTMLTDRLVLLGDFDWYDWSTFEEVRIRFADGRPDGVRPANYRDAYAVAVGVEYPVAANWITRGGLRYDTTPTVDAFRDTTVPDAERLWLGLGATLQVSHTMSLDLAFNHVFFRDTTIALTRTFFDNTPLATATNIASDVSSVVNTIAVDLRIAF